jgi:formamidopyrimidine-DNA glycosylase
LEKSSFWAIHLGMTGQIILRKNQPKTPHIHAALRLEDQNGFFFRDVRQFGFMAYLPDEQSLQTGPLKNMGPDALLISPESFTKSLAGRKAPIKSLLLDQRILAGVGNIYADESLFRAGINPTSRAGEIPQKDLLRLHQVLRELLTQAIDCGGSSIRDYVDAKGEAGTFQDLHQVYGHKGEPCPVCEGRSKRPPWRGVPPIIVVIVRNAIQNRPKACPKTKWSPHCAGSIFFTCGDDPLP